MSLILGDFAVIISGAGCKHHLFSFSLEFVCTSLKSLITAHYCSGVCFYFCILHFILLSDFSLQHLLFFFYFIIPANLQSVCVAEGGAEEEQSWGTAEGSCKTASSEIADESRSASIWCDAREGEQPQIHMRNPALPVQPRGLPPPPGSPSFCTAPCPPHAGVLGG